MATLRVLRISILICAALALPAADYAVSAVHIVGLDYPRLAHLADMQGGVDAVLLIDHDGVVRSVRTASGNGLLADGAIKVLKSWTFTRCTKEGGECEYPMSVRFVLQGGPVNLSECKTEFQFDSPDKIVVISQHAWAIRD
jgi:hypothetical protein